MHNLKNAFWIARAYLSYPHKNVSIRFVLRLCIVGIIIGTASLLISLMVTRGFEDAISTKIRGINAPFIISAQGEKIDYQAFIRSCNDWFGSNVQLSPSTTKQVIINHGDRSAVVYLRGIKANLEAATTTLAQKVVLPLIPQPGAAAEHFKSLLKPDQILIGSTLAQRFDLTVGSEIDLLIPSAQNKKKLNLSSRSVTVGGIVTIGLDEYDAHAAFIDLEVLHNIFNERGADQIALNAKSTEAAEIVATIKKNAPELSITSWQELYPALVESLALEKYALFIILTLISLVACMNMIALLFMQIQEKKRDIALLQVLGCSAKTVRFLFIILGFLVTFVGSLIGIATAWLSALALRKLQIPLPDVYYINYLPVHIEPLAFLIVFCVSILLGLGATLLATANVRKINILETLKH